MRRSHHALKTPSSSLCSNCNEVKFPHSVCESCGHYRGKQVIEPKQNLGLDQNLDVDA